MTITDIPRHCAVSPGGRITRVGTAFRALPSPGPWVASAGSPLTCHRKCLLTPDLREKQRFV